MTDVVARFLFLCRPRGKALPKSYEAAIGIGSTIESNMNKLHGMVCYVGPSKEFQYFLRKIWLRRDHQDRSLGFEEAHYHLFTGGQAAAHPKKSPDAKTF